MKIDYPEPGEWIYPRRRGYRFICCDCNLVHRLDFRLVRNKRGATIEYRAFRDDRMTKRLRSEQEDEQGK